MSGPSQYSKEAFLNWLTGQSPMPSVPTPYLALFTTAPSDDTGAGAVEVSGGNYARLAAGSGWNAASGNTPSTVSNSATQAFVTAGTNWGTIVAMGAYDAVSGGNFLWWAPLTTHQSVLTGANVSFAGGSPGQITLTL